MNAEVLDGRIAAAEHDIAYYEAVSQFRMKLSNTMARNAARATTQRGREQTVIRALHVWASANIAADKAAAARARLHADQSQRGY